MKNPLPTLNQRTVAYHVPCSDCPVAYAGQTDRQLPIRVKKYRGVVRRQDENSLLALRSLKTGRAFDWDRATVIGKETTKPTHFFSRNGTLSPHVPINAQQSILATELYATIGGDEGKRIPQLVKNICANAESHTPPLSPMFMLT